MKAVILLACLFACAHAARYIAEPDDVCTVPLDVVLVFDGSASIDYSSWNEVKQFGLSLLTTLNVSTDSSHVGIVQFSSYARVEDDLDGDEPRVSDDLTNMDKMSMNTAIAQGIDMGQGLFDKSGRASVPHTMILMTDGQNNEPGSPLKSATAAKAKGTEIFVIGVGSGIDPSELKPLASDPVSTHYYTTSSFSQLQDVLRNMTQYTCDFYKCQDATGTCQIVPRGTPGASSKKDCDSSCKKTGGDYVCNVELLTCEMNPGSVNGTDLASCQADCQVHTPSVLIGDWRGLEINQNYNLGEVDVKFTADDVTLTGPSLSLSYKVRSNASELTLIDANGNIRKANYAVQQGPVTMFATIAFGAANSTIPITDFDTAMTTAGDMEITLVACLSAKTCDFSSVPPVRRSEWSDVRVNSEDDEVVDLEFDFVPVQDDPPQQLCSVPADVMFVVDGSGSIQPADWQHMLDFVANMTNDLNVTATQAHVGVYEFSGTGAGKLVDKLDGDRTSIETAIAAMQTLGGRTSLGDGIRNAAAEFKKDGRAGVPSLLILLTDGVDNEQSTPVQAAVDAKAAGIEIVVMAIGNNVDIPTLTAIASQPTATHLFTPADYASLQKYILSVLDTVCPQPIYMCQNTTASSLNDTPSANGTCVQVAPGTPGATSLSVCNSTCGAHPPPPPPVVNDKYLCDNQTLQCVKVNATTPGAQTMEVCNQTCGHKAPIALVGEWRGVEVSQKFLRGEFDLNITQYDMTLRFPTGEITYGYVLAQSPFQFGIDIQKGPGAGQHNIGMFLPTEGPETEFITLALSAPGVSTLPASFDAAMSDANTIVLNMAKCLPHKPCDFSSAMPARP